MDGDRVEVAGEILDAAEGQMVPCVMVSTNWWRAEGLAEQLDKLSAVGEALGFDEVDERELADALRQAVQAVRAGRDTTNDLPPEASSGMLR
jgi:hypothetical protein